MGRSTRKVDLVARRAHSAKLDPEIASLMAMVEANQLQDAEAAARKILGRRTGQPYAMKVLGFSLIGQHRFKEALPIVSASVRANPGDPELLNNLGIVEHELMRWKDAIQHFQRALRLAPKDFEIHRNLGAAYFRSLEWSKAVPPLLKAIELHPGDFVEAIKLLAATLLNGKRHDEALVCFEQLIAADPGDIQALYLDVYASLCNCHWTGLDEKLKRLARGMSESARLLDAPLFSLSIPGLDRDALLGIAKAYSQLWVRPAAEPYCFPSRKTSERLRIGFLSGDFRRHPVGQLIGEVLDKMDRQRFEPIGLSIGPDDGSDVRARLVKSFDRFADMESLGIEETVDRIRAEELDILIDLHGWTTHGRPEALALRCAPVQVNWLGYAGTMGSPLLADFVIGDPVALPEEFGDAFTETIVHLPHCYLPVDSRVGIPSPPSRTDEGLPENGFVFCSFNASHKLNPQSFDIWCRLLRELPGSVLWLSKFGDSAAGNLRREAEQRGVTADRLVFARFVERQEDHLARMRLADLALDTNPYNSHSTGMELLFAGVPLVSKLGEAFHARVGASLLSAAGLPELIAKDDDAYYRIASRASRDSAYLADVRKRLRTAQGSAPLFNMVDFAKGLEAVLLDIWAAHEAKN